MPKTKVYSRRLSPRLKFELEEAARNERKSLADLLEPIAEEWLARSRDRDELRSRITRRPLTPGDRSRVKLPSVRN